MDKYSRCSLISIFIVFIVMWVGIARIVRGQILSLKEQDFVTATKAWVHLTAGY